MVECSVANSNRYLFLCLDSFARGLDLLVDPLQYNLEFFERYKMTHPNIAVLELATWESTEARSSLFTRLHAP